MAESIKDKVAIIGMGVPRWGERWEADIFDLVNEAAYLAYDDAGVEPKQIEACWAGYFYMDWATTGLVLSQALQLQYIPSTHVENGCSTGTEAIRGAAYGLASKQYDLVMALGYEK